MTPEERAQARAEAEAKALAEAQAAEERRRRGHSETVRKISRFTHGPFAANECGRCHDLARTSGFRSSRVGTESLPGSGSQDLAAAGRLHMPVTELCLHCHTDFAREAPENKGLWLHGPVGVGWCVVCHQPHSSPYPHLVHRDPPARLCTQCHQRTDLLAFTAEHRPTEPGDAYPPAVVPDEEVSGAETDAEAPRDQVAAHCTRCHDPHRGLNRFILKVTTEGSR